MAITASTLINRVKTEANITGSYSDARIELLITEAVESLQRFKCKTLVDTVTDADTEVTLSNLDVRYISIYCKLMMFADDKMKIALADTVEQVRDK